MGTWYAHVRDIALYQQILWLHFITLAFAFGRQLNGDDHASSISSSDGAGQLALIIIIWFATMARLGLLSWYTYPQVLGPNINPRPHGSSSLYGRMPKFAS